MLHIFKIDKYFNDSEVVYGVPVWHLVELLGDQAKVLNRANPTIRNLSVEFATRIFVALRVMP